MAAIIQRSAILVLLAGSLLIGLAQAVLLPPFEGFDETMHYSYIQQLAQTGRWPRLGERASRDVDAYKAAAPALGSVPWNYAALFASSNGAVSAARDFIKQAPSVSRTWQPGEEFNWQAQHPPLYYALMTPLYHVTAGWSLAHQLLALRIMSYLFAWAGLCIAAVGFLKSRFSNAPLCALAIGLWPVLFPMWFPEMARLGNDSLVILLSACSLVASIPVLLGTARGWHYAALGLFLGLGLLTKATFLPLTASVGALLLVRLYAARDASAAKGIITVGLLTVALCGWWYLSKYSETGNFMGSNDLTNLSRAAADDARIHLIAKLPLLFAQTFLWYGTWSAILSPRFWSYALLASSSILAYGALLAVRRFGPLERLSLLTLASFLASLTYMAIRSRGYTGGMAWYLHGFAPVLAPLLGLSLAGLASSNTGGTLSRIAFIVPLIFLPAVMAASALYFAGCGVNEPNTGYYDLSSAAHCAGQLTTIIDRLSVLSFPYAFLVLFLAGWGLCIAGVIAILRRSTTLQTV